CLAAGTLENAGHFLTTAGVTINSGTPTAGAIDAPADPHVQLVGTYTPGSGALSSMSLPLGSVLAPGVVTLVHMAATPADLMWITGHLDGDPARGELSYLAG